MDLSCLPNTMSFGMGSFPIIYLLVNSIFCVYCVHVPSSPCPQIFQYVEDTDGTYYGIITFPYTDGAKYNISTEVAAWMPGYHPEIKIKHVEITLITPYEDLINNTARTLVYHVKFPFQSVIPLISAIALNDKIYCNGPPVPANDGNTEFTTCGQTHYLDFPLICEDNQPRSKNYFPLYSKDLQKRNQVQLDFSQITKHNDPNNQIKYVDFPPYIEDNKQNGLQDVPSYSENRESSTEARFINNSPYSVDLSVNDHLNDERDGNSKGYFTKTIRINRATDTADGYSDICGRPTITNSLVFNGKGVPRGAYPWLVALFIKDLNKIGISYTCSGSLVSNKHVITAAHCLKYSRQLEPHEVVCILGKHDINTWEVGEDEKIIQPDALILHPEFSGTPHADIAVITFAHPIIFNQVIKPLCLWQGSNDLKEIVGNIGTVVGWGIQENDPNNAELKQNGMPVVDQFECKKQQTLLEVLSETTFCAGFRNGSGPCSGEAGSPFLIKKNEVFYLRGIVSTVFLDGTGRSCNLKEYVVFTDASKYLDWIKENLK